MNLVLLQNKSEKFKCFIGLVSVDIYLVKVNKRNIRAMFKIYSKLNKDTRTTSMAGLFIVDFELLNTDWGLLMFLHGTEV